jgi:hypothetical protein
LRAHPADYDKKVIEVSGLVSHRDNLRHGEPVTASVWHVARWFHAGVAALSLILTVSFLVRTRFWFPRYIHWLAGLALVIGHVMVATWPANSVGWGAKLLAVLLFPAMIYLLFVILGGQRAAYRARQWVRCPNCGGEGPPGEVCRSCGQQLVSDRPPI